MTYFIVWSTWLHTNWVIATWWQSTINRIIEWSHAFFFSHFWLSRRLSFEERDFFITSNHLIARESVCCCKMSQPSKRRRFIQSTELAEIFLDTDSGDATVSSDSSSVEGGLGCVPGVSHTQPTAKQPVVLSPAVQFRAVPLTKMKPLRLCQVNRLDRQWPYNGHAPLALRAVLHTQIKGAPEERRTMKRPT